MPIISEITSQKNKVFDIRIGEQKLCAMWIVHLQDPEVDIPNRCPYHTFLMVVESQSLSQKRKVSKFLVEKHFDRECSNSYTATF